MMMKKKTVKVKKPNKTGRGKGGFTLVELSVVLALLSILTLMIVSFSVMMHDFAAENQAEYEFMDDSHELAQSLDLWIAENDASGAMFSVSEDGILSVHCADGERLSVGFSNGTLSMGDREKQGLDAVEGISFEMNGTLIKCVVSRTGKNGDIESTHVFSLRAANTGVNAGE